MKKLLIVGLITVLTLVGCESKGDKLKQGDDLEYLYDSVGGDVYAFKDKETGCEYLIANSGSISIIPRYEQSGKIKGCE